MDLIKGSNDGKTLANAHPGIVHTGLDCLLDVYIKGGGIAQG